MDDIKKLFREYLTEMINNFDYQDIDCFCEDRELDEQWIKELQEYLTTLKVVEK